MRTALIETARKLAQARLATARVALAGEHLPANAAEAYAVQDAIGALLEADGAAIRGWKVGAPNAKAVPTAAPIYEVLSAPARIPASRLNMIAIEAEIAYRIGADLPPRTGGYRDEEVLSAVSGLCVAIEVCDSRLADWQAASDLAKLMDHQLNYALVIGTMRPDPTGVDFRRQPVRTRIDGRLEKEGVGCHALDDPRALLPWLAGHAARHGGLRKGSVVTTGSWLGMHFAKPGAEVVVEFPGIGEAAVSFPPQ